MSERTLRQRKNEVGTKVEAGEIIEVDELLEEMQHMQAEELSVDNFQYTSTDNTTLRPPPATKTTTTSTTLKDKLLKWFIRNKPSRKCYEELLEILRAENLDVPLSADYDCACSAQLELRINRLEETVCQQNSAIMDVLSELQDAVDSNGGKKKIVAVRGHRRKERSSDSVDVLAPIAVKSRLRHGSSDTYSIDALFPLTSEHDLEIIDNKIVEENRNQYVSAVRVRLLNGLSKGIRNILSEEVVIDFNVDGTHSKKRLKDYENIYNVILDAIDLVTSDPLLDPPEQQLRKALQTVKKRHFQKVCRDKDGERPAKKEAK